MPTRAELIMLGVTSGALGIGAVTLGPALLDASPDRPETVMPSDPRLVGACQAIDTLFAHSLGIVRVWRDEEGNPRDALLWHRDIRDPDVINRNEVVLLSFSPTLGTLTAYTCANTEPPDLAGELGLELDHNETDREDPCSEMIRRTSIDERFPWRWKTSGHVERSMLASGLEGMTFAPVREPGGTTQWSVEVTWTTAATDATPQACALVVPNAR